MFKQQGVSFSCNVKASKSKWITVLVDRDGLTSSFTCRSFRRFIVPRVTSVYEGLWLLETTTTTPEVIP